MRALRLLTGMALAGSAVSCISRPGTLDHSLESGAQWTATIVPTSGSALHGTVTFVRTQPRSQTRTIFALNGGLANNVVPWHVHYGVCGNDRLIVGEPANYPPLVLGRNGSVNAVSNVPVELTDNATYVIHLHASPTDIHTVIACAALVPDRNAAIVATTSP
jgi:hypothetical protein